MWGHCATHWEKAGESGWVAGRSSATGSHSRIQSADRAQAQTRTGITMCMIYSPHSLGAGESEQKPNMCTLSLGLCRTANFAFAQLRVKLSMIFFSISHKTLKAICFPALRMFFKQTSFDTWQQGPICNQHQAKWTEACHSSCCWEGTVLFTQSLLIQNLFGGQFSCGQW